MYMMHSGKQPTKLVTTWL